MLEGLRTPVAVSARLRREPAPSYLSESIYGAEQLHVRLAPEGEREENPQIYAANGFGGGI